MMTDVRDVVESEFLAPAFFADPYAFYRRLHAEAPVVWSDRIQGWLVCGFDDVRIGLQEERRFGVRGRIDEAAKQLSDQVRQEVPWRSTS